MENANIKRLCLNLSGAREFMLTHALKFGEQNAKPYDILADLERRAKETMHDRVEKHEGQQKQHTKAVETEKGRDARNAADRCALSRVAKDRYERYQKICQFDVLKRANAWVTFEEKPLKISRKLIRKYF